ncbi:hypothetical protein LG943_07355 [Streptomonospora sp. S1-112]|uniref:Uncharacterized protein n=1 Tax=Streptomonospora mangrovi TaxID=2883123 RepID=A0A9X3NJ23_9ACTN|nr:hypothetical protein [Streptomonospora mangrovi]MDA0564143.1 hypothetical protein [Streptomonospora mangrovi]
MVEEVHGAVRGWERTGPLAPLTWPAARTLLGVVHHWGAGDRLADVIPPLLEKSPTNQLVYSVPPGSRFASSGTEFVRRLGAAVLPWEEVRHHGFDLAVAANLGLLDEVRAPTLLLPHGVGYSKLVPRNPGYGPPVRRPLGGAIADGLLRYGRVVPAAIGVPHERQLDQIAEHVPDALQVCHVVGDPCYDRMVAGLRLRKMYRQALGVNDAQRLVLVSSTWGPHSVAGARSGLLNRLPTELAGGYVTAAVLHPGIWWVHGRRQVRAWLEPALRAGLRLLAPEAAWQAALVAADAVLGDQGSLTMYAASLGRPVLLAAGRLTEVAPGSQVAELYRRARAFDADAPARPQIEAAIDAYDPEQGAAMAALLTSAPGCAAERLRGLMYSLMGCQEPTDPPPPHPLPAPTLVGADDRGYAEPHVS